MVSEKVVTGMTSADGQNFFTLEKQGQTWTLVDLIIPLHLNDFPATTRMTTRSEDDIWSHATRDFAQVIEEEKLVPGTRNWLNKTDNKPQGVELTFIDAKAKQPRLRLMYRLSDMALVLYSRDPKNSPLQGLAIPGFLPRQIEPVSIPESYGVERIGSQGYDSDSRGDAENSVRMPSAAQIFSIGACLAGLGAIGFLLLTTVAQSIKVQRLIRK